MYKELPLVFLILGLLCFLRVVRLERCTTCTPDCPNEHAHEISGYVGMTFAFGVATLVSAVWIFA